MQNPHVVILGAGASIAACLNGDRDGRKLPDLKGVENLPSVRPILDRIEQKEGNLGHGFEAKYSTIHSLGKYPDELARIDSAVRAYFSDLTLPNTLNLYDHLVMGLRDKDYIFSFNWDPLLLQAFRRSGGYAPSPSLHFLHGCVGVLLCRPCRLKTNGTDRCPQCGADLEPSPLLYPVAEKDYESDPSIGDEWKEFRDVLSDAYLITIFGYSAPDTDVAAREAMHHAFLENRHRELAQVEIVNTAPREQLESTWGKFVFSHHYSIHEDLTTTQLFRHYRRSCEAYLMASLQVSPVPENSPGSRNSFGEMARFIAPLKREEESGVRFWSDR